MLYNNSLFEQSVMVTMMIVSVHHRRRPRRSRRFVHRHRFRPCRYWCRRSTRRRYHSRFLLLEREASNKQVTNGTGAVTRLQVASLSTADHGGMEVDNDGWTLVQRHKCRNRLSGDRKVSGARVTFHRKVVNNRKRGER